VGRWSRLELTGFVVIAAGMLLDNEILRFPVFSYPVPQSSAPAEAQLDSNA
jgi:hypothetical protein